jgi:hypothetical protein
MTETTPQQAGLQRPVITQEIVTAQFQKKLAAHKYQEALNSLSLFEVTADTLPDAQEKVKKARSFIRTIEAIKTKGKEDALKECRWWDTAFNDLKKPLEQIIADKEKSINDVARKIAEENEKKRKEAERVASIKSQIDQFIFAQTTAITSATSADQLVSIEKLIGSHKANQSRYQEFLPSLIERCEELTPLIKKQKEHIKELEELEKQKAEALANKDDATVLQIQEKEEILQSSIEETKVVIQETAIEGAMSATTPMEVEEVAYVPKARRTSWEFEVVDEKKAFQSGMLVCEINKEKAKAQLDVVKQTIPKGQEEMVVNGIRYYLKKVF